MVSINHKLISQLEYNSGSLFLKIMPTINMYKIMLYFYVEYKND